MYGRLAFGLSLLVAGLLCAERAHAQEAPVFQSITPPGLEALRDVYHLSPAVRVGDDLILSGVIGTQGGAAPASAQEEFDLAWKQIEYTLKSQGVGFENVYQILSFHTDMATIATFAEVKDRYIKPPYPVWSAIGVSALAVPGARAEIKVTARFPK